MPGREHPTVHPMKLTAVDPSIDGTASDPTLVELPPRHDPVLPSRQLRDHPVDRHPTPLSIPQPDHAPLHQRCICHL
jgi:hypothetical protein